MFTATLSVDPMSLFHYVCKARLLSLFMPLLRWYAIASGSVIIWLNKNRLRHKLALFVCVYVILATQIIMTRTSGEECAGLLLTCSDVQLLF